MAEKESVNILTVGDLKKLLNNFNDSKFVNIGTKEYGFEIDSYAINNFSIALMSKKLERRIENNFHQVFKDFEQGTTAMYVGNKNVYPNLTVDKNYEVIYHHISDGVSWLLLKNDNGRNVMYNSQFFEKVD